MGEPLRTALGLEVRPEPGSALRETLRAAVGIVLGSALKEALGDPPDYALDPLLGDKLGTPVRKEVGMHRCLTSRASENCSQFRKKRRVRRRI